MFLLMLKIPVIQLLLSLPITHIILRSFIIACALFVVKTLLGYVKSGYVLLFALLLLSTILYFGLVPVLFFTLVFIASYAFGKIFRVQSGIIAFLLGFFSILELYILTGLLINIQIALYFIAILSVCVLGYSTMKNKLMIVEIWEKISGYVKNTNILDLWVIVSCFIIGSFPQVHWDSVYANLYNAKWYTQLNGFPVLEESISSLFPQNAIAYYSFFFAVGAYKSFQMAFLLPLFSFIALLKSTTSNLQLHDVRKHIIYLFLFSPIIWFQSAAGYYDLLITVLVFAAVFTLLFQAKQNLKLSVLAASLFIGFAAGIRQFSLILGLLPLVIYFVQKPRKKVNLAMCIASLLLVAVPLGVWSVRTFKYTGSPVFPFFQKYFPTPTFWSSGPLEQNFMIQTTMTAKQWMMGGLFTYPFVAYYHSDMFIEGTRGYPTVVYAVMMLVQLFLLGRVVFRLIRRNHLDAFDFVFIYMLLSYFAVGLITRYYRYLFPFQFLLAFTSFIILVRILGKKIIHYKKLLVISGIAIVLLVNLFDIFESFRFYPVNLNNMFHPDTYLSSVPDSVSLINQRSSQNEKVLDASQYLLPRLYLNARVYQCNWYWIAGDKKVASALMNNGKQVELLRKFSYILTSNPGYSGNYCNSLLDRKTNMLKVSENALNVLYKIE